MLEKYPVTKSGKNPGKTSVILAGIVGILVYLGVCWILKVEELHQVFASMKKRWLKIVTKGTTIDEGQNL
jgi:hypothetical protein